MIKVCKCINSLYRRLLHYVNMYLMSNYNENNNHRTVIIDDLEFVNFKYNWLMKDKNRQKERYYIYSCADYILWIFIMHKLL